MAEMASPIEGGIQAARGVGGGDAALYQRVQATESSILSLSSSLNGISQQMSQFSLSLNSISANIVTETNLERQKERQEQQQEFLLAQQQIREGKESAIERKIQASLSAPVQKISAKAENTLGRLKQVLTGVLFGWLAVSTVGLIKKYSVDVPSKLTAVRDSILKGLNTAGQFLSTIKSGIKNTFDTISAISSRVAQHVNGKWFMEPIVNLVNAVKDAFKRFFNIGKGKDEQKPTGTGGSPEPANTTGTGDNVGNMTPTEGGETGTQTTPEADTGAMSGLSNLLMSPAALQNLGAAPTENTGAQPTTPMVNPLQINQEPVSSGKDEIHSEQQESQVAMYGEFTMSPLENVEGLDMSSTPVGTQQTPTAIAQISPVTQQDVSQRVGALPEPKANVIVASAPAQQQAQQSGYSQGKAPASDIPAIPSSNPNNFYAMYSKTVYNVVG